MLALIQVSPLERRDELLGAAQVVVVVSFATPAQRDARGVMQVVVPERVAAEAALRYRLREARFLRFVLGADEHAPALPAPRRTRSLGDVGDHVPGRVVDDALGGVEPQPIKAKFIDALMPDILELPEP